MYNFNMCVNYVTQLRKAVVCLQKQDKIVHDIRPATVFAPVGVNSVAFHPVCQSFSNRLTFILLQCPHEMMCPKLAVESVKPCNFQQPYHPLPRPGVRPNSVAVSVKTSAAQTMTHSFHSSIIHHRQRSSVT